MLGARDSSSVQLFQTFYLYGQSRLLVLHCKQKKKKNERVESRLCLSIPELAVCCKRSALTSTMRTLQLAHVDILYPQLFLVRPLKHMHLVADLGNLGRRELLH